MYLHKAPHRSWLMAERHMEEFTNKTFPEPATLFDGHEGMPAAKVAQMKINGNMGWAADSKLYPEVMDQLGLEEQIGYDKMRFEMGVGRMDSTQKATFDKNYRAVSDEFVKQYPTMTEKDIIKITGGALKYGILVGVHKESDLSPEVTARYTGLARQIHFENQEDIMRYGKTLSENKKDHI